MKWRRCRVLLHRLTKCEIDELTSHSSFGKRKELFLPHSRRFASVSSAISCSWKTLSGCNTMSPNSSKALALHSKNATSSSKKTLSNHNTTPNSAVLTSSTENSILRPKKMLSSSTMIPPSSTKTLTNCNTMKSRYKALTSSSKNALLSSKKTSNCSTISSNSKTMKSDSKDVIAMRSCVALSKPLKSEILVSDSKSVISDCSRMPLNSSMQMSDSKNGILNRDTTSKTSKLDKLSPNSSKPLDFTPKTPCSSSKRKNCSISLPHVKTPLSDKLSSNSSKPLDFTPKIKCLTSKTIKSSVSLPCGKPPLSNKLSSNSSKPLDFTSKSLLSSSKIIKKDYSNSLVKKPGSCTKIPVSSSKIPWGSDDDFCTQRPSKKTKKMKELKKRKHECRDMSTHKKCDQPSKKFANTSNERYSEKEKESAFDQNSTLPYCNLQSSAVSVKARKELRTETKTKCDIDKNFDASKSAPQLVGGSGKPVKKLHTENCPLTVKQDSIKNQLSKSPLIKESFSGSDCKRNTYTPTFNSLLEYLDEVSRNETKPKFKKKRKGECIIMKDSNLPKKSNQSIEKMKGKSVDKCSIEGNCSTVKSTDKCTKNCAEQPRESPIENNIFTGLIKNETKEKSLKSTEKANVDIQEEKVKSPGMDDNNSTTPRLKPENSLSNWESSVSNGLSTASKTSSQASVIQKSTCNSSNDVLSGIIKNMNQLHGYDEQAFPIVTPRPPKPSTRIRALYRSRLKLETEDSNKTGAATEFANSCKSEKICKKTIKNKLVKKIKNSVMMRIKQKCNNYAKSQSLSEKRYYHCKRIDSSQNVKRCSNSSKNNSEKVQSPKKIITRKDEKNHLERNSKNDSRNEKSQAAMGESLQKRSKENVQNGKSDGNVKHLMQSQTSEFCTSMDKKQLLEITKDITPGKQCISGNQSTEYIFSNMNMNSPISEPFFPDCSDISDEDEISDKNEIACSSAVADGSVLRKLAPTEEEMNFPKTSISNINPYIDDTGLHQYFPTSSVHDSQIIIPGITDIDENHQSVMSSVPVLISDAGPDSRELEVVESVLSASCSRELEVVESVLSTGCSRELQVVESVVSTSCSRELEVVESVLNTNYSTDVEVVEPFIAFVETWPKEKFSELCSSVQGNSSKKTHSIYIENSPLKFVNNDESEKKFTDVSPIKAKECNISFKLKPEAMPKAPGSNGENEVVQKKVKSLRLCDTSSLENLTDKTRESIVQNISREILSPNLVEYIPLNNFYQSEESKIKISSVCSVVSESNNVSFDNKTTPECKDNSNIPLEVKETVADIVQKVSAISVGSTDLISCASETANSHKLKCDLKQVSNSGTILKSNLEKNYTDPIIESKSDVKSDKNEETFSYFFSLWKEIFPNHSSVIVQASYELDAFSMLACADLRPEFDCYQKLHETDKEMSELLKNQKPIDRKKVSELVSKRIMLNTACKYVNTYETFEKASESLLEKIRQEIETLSRRTSDRSHLFHSFPLLNLREREAGNSGIAEASPSCFQNGQTHSTVSSSYQTMSNNAHLNLLPQSSQNESASMQRTAPALVATPFSSVTSQPIEQFHVLNSDPLQSTVNNLILPLHSLSTIEPSKEHSVEDRTRGTSCSTVTQSLKQVEIKKELNENTKSPGFQYSIAESARSPSSQSPVMSEMLRLNRSQYWESNFAAQHILANCVNNQELISQRNSSSLERDTSKTPCTQSSEQVKIKEEQNLITSSPVATSPSSQSHVIPEILFLNGSQYCESDSATHHVSTNSANNQEMISQRNSPSLERETNKTPCSQSSEQVKIKLEQNLITSSPVAASPYSQCHVMPEILSLNGSQYCESNSATQHVSTISANNQEISQRNSPSLERETSKTPCAQSSEQVKIKLEQNLITSSPVAASPYSQSHVMPEILSLNGSQYCESNSATQHVSTNSANNQEISQRNSPSLERETSKTPCAQSSEQVKIKLEQNLITSSRVATSPSSQSHVMPEILSFTGSQYCESNSATRHVSTNSSNNQEMISQRNSSSLERETSKTPCTQSPEQVKRKEQLLITSSPVAKCSSTQTAITISSPSQSMSELHFEGLQAQNTNNQMLMNHINLDSQLPDMARTSSTSPNFDLFGLMNTSQICESNTATQLVSENHSSNQEQVNHRNSSFVNISVESVTSETACAQSSELLKTKQLEKITSSAVATFSFGQTAAVISNPSHSTPEVQNFSISHKDLQYSGCSATPLHTNIQMSTQKDGHSQCQEIAQTSSTSQNLDQNELMNRPQTSNMENQHVSNNGSNNQELVSQRISPFMNISMENEASKIPSSIATQSAEKEKQLETRSSPFVQGFCSQIATSVSSPSHSIPRLNMVRLQQYGRSSGSTQNVTNQVALNQRNLYSQPQELAQMLHTSKNFNQYGLLHNSQYCESRATTQHVSANHAEFQTVIRTNVIQNTQAGNAFNNVTTQSAEQFGRREQVNTTNSPVAQLVALVQTSANSAVPSSASSTQGKLPSIGNHSHRSKILALHANNQAFINQRNLHSQSHGMAQNLPSLQSYNQHQLPSGHQVPYRRNTYRLLSPYPFISNRSTSGCSQIPQCVPSSNMPYMQQSSSTHFQDQSNALLSSMMPHQPSSSSFLTQFSDGSSPHVSSYNSSSCGPPSYSMQNQPNVKKCAQCGVISQTPVACVRCSKVFFCNETCAVFYWYSRHRMECNVQSAEYNQKC